MDKRLLLAFLVSLVIVFGWTLVQRRFAPPPTPPTSATAPSAPSGGPAAPPPQAPATPSAESKPAAPRAPEERTAFERPGWFRAVFTSWGAAPTEFVLQNPQYKVSTDGRTEPINMVDTAGRLPYLVWFDSAGAESERSDFSVPANAAWTLVRKTDDSVVYAYDAGPVHIEKKWTLPREGFELGLEVAIENKGDKPLTHRMRLAVNGFQNPNVKPGGFWSFGKRVNLRQAECDLAGKVKRVTRSGGGGGCTGGGGGEVPSWSEPIREAGDLLWVGINEQYFISAAALGPGAEGAACQLHGEVSGRLTAEAVYPAKTLAAHARETFQLAAYAGPKVLKRLDDVHVAGRDNRLGDSVNYTLEFIARPLQWVLTQLHRVVRNWGVAIILITILLKLLLLYPTQQSMKSMKQMAKLKPEIDEIKKRYANDSVRQNQETMALYKKYGVNPLGSCLPMMLQLPIYFAFYSMLSNAVELYRSSFVGPMDDMTAPWAPLAVVTGALMYLQQKLAPTQADPQQAKMMAMMPILFTGMTLLLPSGLTLYIFTNTLLTMVHQWWINRGEGGRVPLVVGRS